MSKKTRVRGAVWTMLIGAILFFGMAYWWLIQKMPIENFVAYPSIGIGIILLVLIPFVARAAGKRADKQAEMEEMLEEYRRRKQRP